MVNVPRQPGAPEHLADTSAHVARAVASALKLANSVANSAAGLHHAATVNLVGARPASMPPHRVRRPAMPAGIYPAPQVPPNADDSGAGPTSSWPGYAPPLSADPTLYGPHLLEATFSLLYLGVSLLEQAAYQALGLIGQPAAGFPTLGQPSVPVPGAAGAGNAPDGSLGLVIPSAPRGAVTQVVMVVENTSNMSLDPISFYSTGLWSPDGHIPPEALSFSPASVAPVAGAPQGVTISVAVSHAVRPGRYVGVIQAVQLEDVRTVLEVTAV